MTGQPISVSFVADTRELDRGLRRTETALNDTGREAQEATEKVEKVFLRVTDRADAAATNFSILGGAVGDVAGGIEAFGSKLGVSEEVLGKVTAGSEFLSTALMFGAGVSDIAALSGELLNGVNLKSTAIKYKDAAASKAKAIADKAGAVVAKGMAAAQWAVNAAMAANPITLVVLALVALGAGLVIAYKKSETFRKIVNAGFAKVKAAAGAVASFFTRRIPAALSAVASFAARWSLPGLIFRHIDKVKGFFNGLVSFVRGLPRKISTAANGIFDGIKNAFRGAINFLIRSWNNLEFKIDLPKIVGGGSVGIGTPNIPELAKGGIVDRPTLAIIGEAGPEAVVPLNGRYGIGGNTYVIKVQNVPVGASAADVGRTLVRYIDAYERNGGRRRAA